MTKSLMFSLVLAVSLQAAPTSTPLATTLADIQAAGVDLTSRFQPFTALVQPYAEPTNNFFESLYQACLGTLNDWEYLRVRISAASPDPSELLTGCAIMTDSLDIWEGAYENGEPWLARDPHPEYRQIYQYGLTVRPTVAKMRAACVELPKVLPPQP